MSKLRKLFLAVLALSVLLLSGCADGKANQAEENNPAPTVEDNTSIETESPSVQISFETTDMEGNVVSSDIFSQSKLTMINVWATYCNPCLSEMPELAELASEYETEEFQLIGIISDVLEGEDQTLAESLIQQTGANYTHLLLNESVYYALLTDVSAVPTTFFLDADGTVLGAVIGAQDKSAWEDIVNGLLEKL